MGPRKGNQTTDTIPQTSVGTPCGLDTGFPNTSEFSKVSASKRGLSQVKNREETDNHNKDGFYEHSRCSEILAECMKMRSREWKPS